MSSTSERERKDQTRTYRRAESIVFLKTDDPFGGLSNMAGGFPLRVNGLEIRTSEALYQACRFPHLPNVQELIIEQKSPMTAKMKSKPHRKNSRPDWDRVRVKIMRWCLRVKLAQNWETFSRLLQATGERPIVEESRKDAFWGAKPMDDETLVGMNVLGRLLMELRAAVQNEGRERLLKVDKLDIPDFLLGGRPIGAVIANDAAMTSTEKPGQKPRPATATSPKLYQPSLFDSPESPESVVRDSTADPHDQPGIAHLKPYPTMKDSDVPWLGAVPEHWDVRRMKTICVRSALYGANVTATSYTARGVRFLRTTDITDDGELRGEGVYLPEESVSDYLLEDGDLLISRSGTIGRSFLYDAKRHGPCAYAGYLVRFVPGSEVLPKYLFLFTKTQSFAGFLGVMAISSTIENVNGEKYANSSLPLPPLPEQAAIVRFLDYADRRIRRYVRAKQKLIKLLEEQKQAIIHRAVTRGLDPNVRLKPSGVEWLGDVPEHWDVRRIASFSPKITNGWVGPTRDILRDDGVPYVQSLHVKRGLVRFAKRYFVDRAWLDARPKICLREGDVVVVQTGDIGQVACIPPEFDGAGCHALIIIRTDPTVMSGRFLDLVLRSRYGFESLKSLQTGALHPHLNCTWVREIVVPVPPGDEQNTLLQSIGNATSTLDRAVADAEAEISLLREYRTRLIADVVTGKLDVREAAALLPDEVEEADVEEEADALEDEGADSMLAEAEA